MKIFYIMKKSVKKLSIHRLGLMTLLLIIVSCGPKWIESERDGIMVVSNTEGQTLGYSLQSGVQILTVDRYGFKDLNKNGIHMRTGEQLPRNGQKILHHKCPSNR